MCPLPMPSGCTAWQRLQWAAKGIPDGTPGIWASPGLGLTLQQWKASWRKAAGQSIPTMVRKAVTSRPKSCTGEMGVG